MVQLTRAFALLAVVSVGLAASVKRANGATIIADFKLISDGVGALNKASGDFSADPKNPTKAISIHTAAVTLQKQLQTTAGDAQNTAAISEADGKTIVGAVCAIADAVADTINNLIKNKDNFNNLPVHGVLALVCTDIKNNESSEQSVSDNLLPKCPKDLVAQATGCLNKIQAALNNGIAAYCP
ncbi:hypothetical protein MVEN_01823100 [Mycena venus]|uniref:Uncharacterized protein n=1 Tax=Mycena venus TaxID=2733690 RepID=A0A8H6XIW3_9AGAR|nr:hypothetical protein MVEN_01823100 [Mycena venus]